MALQGPFFGKREEPGTPRTPGNPALGGTSSLGSASSAQPFSAPSGVPTSSLPCCLPPLVSASAQSAYRPRPRTIRLVVA